MQAPKNHIFIKVDSEHNDEVETKSGIRLFLTTKRFAVDDETSNANHKPMMLQRNYGIVFGKPGELDNTALVRQIDPGQPAPSRYISADRIKEELDYNPNALIDSNSTLPLFEHKWVTCDDLEMEVQEGDKIYFHHNTISSQNIVSYLGDKIYKLPYHHALCVVRDIVNPGYRTALDMDKGIRDNAGWIVWDKKDVHALRGPLPETLLSVHINLRENKNLYRLLIPIAGTVLIEPLWEDGVEDLGDGKKGKMTASGIVTELHDKPKHLHGLVKFVCSPIKGESVDLVPGDKIIYIPNADYEVEIEGKKYYVMKYWDILAKLDEEEQLEIPSPAGFIENI